MYRQGIYESRYTNQFIKSILSIKAVGSIEMRRWLLGQHGSREFGRHGDGEEGEDGSWLLSLLLDKKGS
jgi:hypothetical protein